MSASKALVAGAAAYGAWSYADSKLNLSSDFAFMKNMSAMGTVQKRIEGLSDAGGYGVADIWGETLARHPDKICMIFAEDGTTLTFKQVDERSNQIARWTKAQGLGRGDTVALFMENRPEYIITWLGLCKVGVAVAMINSNNLAKPLLHSISVVDCKTVIFGTELNGPVSGVLADLEAEGRVLVASGAGCPPFARSLEDELPPFSDAPVDKSLRAGVVITDTFGYIYTSGTTGLPKACIINHGRFVVVGHMLGAGFGVSPEERLYTCLPLYHTAGGMIGVGCMFSTGCTLILSRKFSASRIMDHIVRYKANVTQYIGELCRYMLNSPETPSDRAHCLRIAIGNGLRREIWPKFCQRFNIPEIGELYGSTEGNISFINHSVSQSGVGAVGRAGWLLQKFQGFRFVKHDVATEMPIRDPVTGFCIECATDEPGELLGFIDQSNAGIPFDGYTDKDASAKKVLDNVLAKGDKYFRTGDLMRKDAQGWIYFLDRIGDTFRWKGENVSTNEVSEVVSVFPGVLEANVYGVKVPGAEDGRAPMAAIVCDTPPDMEALLKHIQLSLASYAVPIFLRLLPQMEITGTFKHRKVELVKDGIDTSKFSDAVFWLDPSTRKYVLLDAAALATISAGKARL